MSVSVDIPVIEWQLWPQQDARDPLGIWTARGSTTGDVSGGVLGARIVVPQARRRAYIYTCYGLTQVRVSGSTEVATQMKVRLLTNYPDASPTAPGITGYASWMRVPITVIANTTAPNAGGDLPMLSPEQRFILLFDPSAVDVLNDMPIVEIERDANVDGIVVNTEGWGYYWDRSILNTPGGPRHPGAS